MEFASRVHRAWFPQALLVTLLILAPGGDPGAQSGAEETVTIDGRTWALTLAEGPSSWSDAAEFCDTLDTGSYSDWRLPLLEELELLLDSNSPTGIKGPFELPDCCAWSSQSAADLPADRKGDLPEPAGPPAAYYWGLVFEGGISYYANGRFTDGFAMCTRD